MCDNDRIKALAQHLTGNAHETPEQLAHCRAAVEEDIAEETETCFSYGREEYLVLTDDEADELWDESLENYIDECILGEVPKGIAETLAHYFDRESWKRDARFDGRGHSLSSYDGAENEEKVNGVYYYIYRQN